MHLTRIPEQVCDAEYREARTVVDLVLKSAPEAFRLWCQHFDRAIRSPAAHKKAVRSLPAPVRPAQPVSTRNQAAWVAVGAFLADRVVNP